MREPLKYGYRALGIIFIIICGIIALALLAAGLTLAGLSWLPYISPGFLENYRLSFLGNRIDEPSEAFLLLLMSGLTFAAVGIILIGFLYQIIKILVKDLSSEEEIEGNQFQD
ncbi:MAG: hypothetical protein ACFFFH_17900 [Candidatus Thorarchaeota archaeon]